MSLRLVFGSCVLATFFTASIIAYFLLLEYQGLPVPEEFGISFNDDVSPSSYHRFLYSPISSFALHIFPSMIYGPLLMLQFNTGFRKSFPAIHRLSGWVFTFCAFAMAIGVIGMNRNPKTNYSLPLNHPSFFTLEPLSYISLGWAGLCLVRAISFIRNRNIKQHERWIIRHCLGTMSVGAQRILMIPIWGTGAIVNNHSTTLEKKVFFSYCMWIAFTACVAGGEIYLYEGKRNKLE